MWKIGIKCSHMKNSNHAGFQMTFFLYLGPDLGIYPHHWVYLMGIKFKSNRSTMSTMQEQTISQLLHSLCSDLNRYFKHYEVIRTMGNMYQHGFFFHHFPLIKPPSKYVGDSTAVKTQDSGEYIGLVSMVRQYQKSANLTICSFVGEHGVNTKLALPKWA